MVVLSIYVYRRRNNRSSHGERDGEKRSLTEAAVDDLAARKGDICRVHILQGIATHRRNEQQFVRRATLTNVKVELLIKLSAILLKRLV
jgi:hypothetical protein